MKHLVVILCIAIAVLVAKLYCLSWLVSDLSKANNRLRENQQILRAELSEERYATRTGDTAVRASRMTFSHKELKQDSAIRHDMENFKIRLRDVQSIDRHEAESRYVFVPETIYVREAPTLAWSDPWTTFSEDSSGVSFVSYDTISIVKHQRVRKILWWTRAKTKKVTVHNANPHTRMTIKESIDVE